MDKVFEHYKFEKEGKIFVARFDIPPYGYAFVENNGDDKISVNQKAKDDVYAVLGVLSNGNAFIENVYDDTTMNVKLCCLTSPNVRVSIVGFGMEIGQRVVLIAPEKECHKGKIGVIVKKVMNDDHKWLYRVRIEGYKTTLRGWATEDDIKPVEE